MLNPSPKHPGTSTKCGKFASSDHPWQLQASVATIGCGTVKQEDRKCQRLMPCQLQKLYKKLDKSTIAKGEEDGDYESKEVTVKGHKNLSYRAP